MQSYHQMTYDERHVISSMRNLGCNNVEIAKELGRHPSTIGRELKRNCNKQGGYTFRVANKKARSRLRNSRRQTPYTALDWWIIEAYLMLFWSPEQIAGRLWLEGKLSISYETIYRHVWKNMRRGGDLHGYLRQAQKKRRKVNGSSDSRGRVSNKRMIEERPLAADERSEVGHWEIDTVLGCRGSKACVVTLVDRKTGYVMIGIMPNRTKEETSKRTIMLLSRHPGVSKTITADNGTEFHGYEIVEAATGVEYYFANPYHSWERGSNENTNGLIRQYLRKGVSMENISQQKCNSIAESLNSRPRKRLGYRTPTECFEEQIKIALQS